MPRGGFRRAVSGLGSDPAATMREVLTHSGLGVACTSTGARTPFPHRCLVNIDPAPHGHQLLATKDAMLWIIGARGGARSALAVSPAPGGAATWRVVGLSATGPRVHATRAGGDPEGGAP